jgi:flagellar biosynthesis protein FlhG
MKSLPQSDPSAGNPLADLQPARVQFIQQSFPEVLGDTRPAAPGEGLGRKTQNVIRWIHDRLFVDGWQMPAVRAELGRALRNVRTIAVTSGKGGVGKTTFSVNLAVAFARLGGRVLVFDADLGMANVHVFAGINPAATLLDVIDRRANLRDVIEAGPGGISVVCGASGVSRLAGLTVPVIEALGRELLAAASAFDVLIIDTGAGISPMVTHFLGLVQDAIVVATPNLAATLDAYGLVKVVHESRLATRMHVLINQVEDEEQGARVMERITGCASRFLEMPLGDLGCLFRDPAFEQANQKRRPLVALDPVNENAQRITQIAMQLSAPAAAARKHAPQAAAAKHAAA